MRATLEQTDEQADETNNETNNENTSTPASQGEAVEINIDLPDPDYSAAIYLRLVAGVGETPIDSNDPPAESESTYEAVAYFNGRQCFTNVGMGTPARLFVLEDAAKAIQAAASKGRKKADREAAAVVAEFIRTMDGMGLDGPEGVACEWPVEVEEGEQAANDEQQAGQTTDQPDAPAEGLAGEVDSAAPDQPTPDAVRTFENRIAALSRELVAAVLDRVSLENQLKTAKSLEKEIIGEIQSASARGPERLPLFDRSEVEAGGDDPDHPTTPQAGSEANSDGETATTTAPTTPPDAWRITSIDALGLPPKLAERLNENGITTIGQLEDKRAEFNGLRSIKGIGQAKVDAIETAVIDWLTKNRPGDAAAFAAVK